MKLISIKVALLFLLSLIAVGLYHNLIGLGTGRGYAEDLGFVGLSAILVFIVYLNQSFDFRGYVGGIIVFILVCTISDFVSLEFATTKSVYRWLAMPTEVIGYYPAGPDAPWFIGIILWAVSACFLCAVATLIGLSFCSIVRRKEGLGNSG